MIELLFTKEWEVIMDNALLKQYAEMLHLCLCNREHEDQLENAFTTDKCAFYVLESLDTCWEEDDRVIWLRHATEIMVTFGKLGEKEVYEHTQKVLLVHILAPKLLRKLMEVLNEVASM